jgi:crossover junction endonuclease MUS81
MSTLTRKGLVCKYSCPAKYSLTDAGKILAIKLETVNKSTHGHSNPQAIHSTHKDQHHISHSQQCLATTQPHSQDKLIDICHVNESSDEDVVERESLAERLCVCPHLTVPSVCTQDAMPSRQWTYQTQEHGSTMDSINNSDDFTPSYSLLPGEFDVVLCIDYAEATGITERRIPIIQELRKNGVLCDMRKLQVGDFLWIAKEHMKPVAGMLALPEGRELTLGHIVERKRLDDLSSSKIDGRFREQKFRLKECGLSHVIYLIEDCYHKKPLSIPEDHLRQTIVNMQVLDDLQIKHTKNFNDTVAYLTIMTRMLTSIYKDKILVSCPKSRLPRSVDLTASTVKLMTFEEFSKSSVKNKVLTVREVFGKQLVQFDGISAELAIEILEKFPTVDSLLNAYDRLTSEEEKRNLLTDIRHGKTDK